MSLFFKSPIDIEILFDSEESRKHVEIPTKPGSNARTLKDNLPLYEDGESINGIVTIRVREGKTVEHLGIKVAVIGSIDMVKTSGGGSTNNSKISSNASNTSVSDARKRPVDQFLFQSYDLCPAGELQHTQSFNFIFKDLTKAYESYRGKNVDVSYYIKVTVLRKSTDISKSRLFWVYLYNSLSVNTDVSANISIPAPPPVQTDEERESRKHAEESVVAASSTQESLTKDAKMDDSKPFNKPVKLDIGIENCLHIEFEYAKAQYSLKDVIVGRIYFLLTRLKIKHMELSLITRESSGLKPSAYLLDSTAIRYEIMDGSPVKGETIPIRLFLGGYDLTPNMTCNYFNVKNYLSLVIIDEDGRRYFKQSEIILYRTR